MVRGKTVEAVKVTNMHRGRRITGRGAFYFHKQDYEANG
jgi:hypothetical protein